MVPPGRTDLKKPKIESKASVGSRNIIYLIKKVESKWWTRLLKKEGKSPVFLKVDWNKWIDEDEQEEEDESNMNLDDINFSVLQMGGSGDDYGQALDDDEGKYYTGFVGAGKREYEAIGKWILYFGFTIVMMYDM